ncbi:MAG TPA: hypothetical protein VNW49_14640 [Puia sp.]|nr:hypothetical protein [Puia sp.]
MFSRNALLFYILVLSLTTFYLSRFPGHNGDMPFYIALAIEKDQGSMEGVVDRTKEVLRQELPPAEYQDHADRISNADPLLFERYRIKPLYILLVLAFHKLGFSYIHATLAPSLLCYFLIGLSIWQVAVKRLGPVKTFLAGMTCMLIFPTLLLARLSSPDSLSCFILLNAVFLIYNGRSKILWYSLFMLAICTRLDNVVAELIFLFALWQWPVEGFTNKLDTKKYIILSLGLIAVSLLVNLTAPHQFFWFKDPNFPNPQGQYLKSAGLYFYVIPGSFFMYLFILFIFSGLSRGYNWKQEVNYIFYTVCMVVLVRFLLYPFYEERYMTPYLLFSLLTISFYYADLGKSLKTSPFQGV